MVLPLDALIDPDPAVALLAYRSLMVSGKLYGVPHSFQVPGLYYKTDTIPSPPVTTDALLNMVRRDLIITAAPLATAYPFCTAFGGQLMDANGRCIADQGGFKEAMDYWLALVQRRRAVRHEREPGARSFRQQLLPHAG